ncbi:MAG: hypothetical protein CK543_03235 [Flavobacteriales bacterium]|nr:MAG: hypothetical protein CK543_03235 [Flavobacteriales bacterium]
MAVKISGIAWNRNHGMDVRKKAQNHMAKKIHCCFSFRSVGNNFWTSWKMPTKSKINGGSTTISPRMG